jgi:wyosine [tRNA(Phe)-imidazoG37] synthetase (radical SAM superfamily)
MQARRQAFYEPESVWREVEQRVTQARQATQVIDYLTFVPDGEPTLDINLGAEIDRLKRLNLPIGVITNASLIWRPDVAEQLMGADWVSLKVDAVQEEIWRRVDRPCASLELALILEGALRFASVYQGKLVTETMLIEGVNDDKTHLRAVADFLERLRPGVAYLSIPTRPPAESWVRAAGARTITHAYHLLSEKVDRVEYLIGYEGNAFASTGDAEQDLLSITAVHPMRQDAVSDYLVRAGAKWDLIRRLVEKGELVEMPYAGHTFYLRKLRRPANAA